MTNLTEEDWIIAEARLQHDIDMGYGGELALAFIGKPSQSTGDSK